MVHSLSPENLGEISLMRKIVGFRKGDQVYILATGQKNGTMFVPMIRTLDYKYKGKNEITSIKSAIQNGEQVVACDSPAEFFKAVS